MCATRIIKGLISFCAETELNYRNLAARADKISNTDNPSEPPPACCKEWRLDGTAARPHPRTRSDLFPALSLGRARPFTLLVNTPFPARPSEKRRFAFILLRRFAKHISRALDDSLSLSLQPPPPCVKDRKNRVAGQTRNVLVFFLLSRFSRKIHLLAIFHFFFVSLANNPPSRASKTLLCVYSSGRSTKIAKIEKCV